MVFSVLESWALLLYFDWIMHVRGFQQIHSAVRHQQVDPMRSSRTSDAALCHAMDLACVLYFKRVLCLQRSAATATLLRRHGKKAEMVIGARLFPFESHAWVEVNQRVVSDKPDFTRMFHELERC